jgi:hypothetical protein
MFFPRSSNNPKGNKNMNKNCLSAIIALMLSLNAAQSAHLYPSDKIDFDSFGADPTGIMDSHIALQNYIDAKIAAVPTSYFPSAKGYDAVLPPGRFVNSSPLNLAGRSNNYIGAFSLRGAPGGATIIEGDISGGYLVRRVVAATTKGPSTIRDIHFINYSGGCVSIGGLVGLNVSSCKFNSHGVMLNLAELGTTAPEDTFDVTVTGCIFFGGPPGGAATADQADAIGILSHGQTSMTGNSFTALAEGVRLSGTGFSLTGGRFEVNKIGMNLGIRENGGTWLLDRAFFGGISFEANDTAIWMQHVVSSSFTGIAIQGSAASPSGGSQYGIRMNASGGSLVTVSSTYVIGAHSVAAISALDKRAIWISVNAQNPVAGRDWMFPTTAFYDHFINCTGVTTGGTDQGPRSRVSQTVSVTKTTYTMRDDNKGKVVTFKNASPVAVSLPKPNQFSVAEQYYKFDQTWNVRIKNLGTGIVTITPVASTIDGGASISLSRYQSIEVRSGGANYYVSGH